MGHVSLITVFQTLAETTVCTQGTTKPSTGQCQHTSKVETFLISRARYGHPNRGICVSFTSLTIALTHYKLIMMSFDRIWLHHNTDLINKWWQSFTCQHNRSLIYEALNSVGQLLCKESMLESWQHLPPWFVSTITEFWNKQGNTTPVYKRKSPVIQSAMLNVISAVHCNGLRPFHTVWLERKNSAQSLFAIFGSCFHMQRIPSEFGRSDVNSSCVLFVLPLCCFCWIPPSDCAWQDVTKLPIVLSKNDHTNAATEF